MRNPLLLLILNASAGALQQLLPSNLHHNSNYQPRDFDTMLPPASCRSMLLLSPLPHPHPPRACLCTPTQLGACGPVTRCHTNEHGAPSLTDPASTSPSVSSTKKNMPSTCTTRVSAAPAALAGVLPVAMSTTADSTFTLG